MTEREVRVASIITDLWPHRMSRQAAASIEALYQREMGPPSGGKHLGGPLAEARATWAAAREKARIHEDWDGRSLSKQGTAVFRAEAEAARAYIRQLEEARR